MRKIIESGELGKVRAITMLAYTDWMLRPRSADELDFNQGGGVPYRQGPHQLDAVRLLGGGMMTSVRAQIGQWMPERPIPGYYNGHFMFEDGTVATAIHNGYGYFRLSEVNGPRDGRGGTEDRVKIRQAMAVALNRAGIRTNNGGAFAGSLGDGAEVGVDPKVLACRPDRGSDGVEGAGPPQPGMARVLDPGGAEDTTTPIEQGHVRLGIPAVDREDRGPHGACSLIHGS